MNQSDSAVLYAGDMELQLWVDAAREGDPDALDALLERIQPRIYNLALRMLQDPADAEDAAQEILIKVITHLAEFRGEAAFTTWVYRVASNHLLTTRKRRAERQEASFDNMAERLNLSLAMGEMPIPEQVEEAALIAEVKIHCTLGMLMCLDQEGRIALILGDVMEVSADEAAYILNIPATTYRKRLSRARAKLKHFIHNQCGLVNPANPCRCAKHVGNKMAVGLLDPAALAYVPPLSQDEVRRQAAGYCEEMDALRHEIGLLRAVPQYDAPFVLLNGLRELLNSRRYAVTGETPQSPL